jgi:hypothetical protein
MIEQEKPQRLYFALLSVLAGFSAAYNLAINTYQESLQTYLDWIVMLSLLTFAFGVIFFLLIPYWWNQYQSSSALVRRWVFLLILTAALFFSWNSSALVFIPALIFQLFISSILLSAGFAAFQKILEQGYSARFWSAWALGTFFAFLGMGFLQNFYPTYWEFIVLGIPVTILATLAWDIILEYAVTSIKLAWREKVIPLGALAVGIALMLLTAKLLTAYERMFSFNFFLPTSKLVAVFLGLALISQSWSAFLLNWLDQFHWRSSNFIRWIRRNIPGLLLASALAIATFSLAIPFLATDAGTVDNYFDTDSVDWINRLSSNLEDLHQLRSVHPFAFLLLRPPTWLLSLFLNGDKFHAAILLNSLAGGLCVYLTWRFFKRRTKNTAYALLIAALLGLSNSHLILSTFLETYIFSSAALIAFLFLLESETYSTKQLIPAAVVVFGITITNFVQTCILYIMNPARRRSTLVFVTMVLVIAIFAAFVQDIMYPSNNPFFIPSNLMGESAYRFNIFKAEPRLIISRINLLLRHIALFDVVAPRPLILTNEVGCSFPCMQTYYKHRGVYVISSYVGFGSWLARTWFAALLIAGGIYLRRLLKFETKAYLQTALLLTILFNFILHMFYGDDPILYSPDWTYAVVFFFGISYENLARKKWFQVILLIFLTCLLINNLDLFRKTLEAISAFL